MVGYLYQIMAPSPHSFILFVFDADIVGMLLFLFKIFKFYLSLMLGLPYLLCFDLKTFLRSTLLINLRKITVETTWVRLERFTLLQMTAQSLSLLQFDLFAYLSTSL